MSFYVTLPSNSSMSTYKNTVTNFKVKLEPSIELEGAYEVALAEITYPYTWVSSKTEYIGFSYTVQDPETKTTKTLQKSLNINPGLVSNANELQNLMNKYLNDNNIDVKMFYVLNLQKWVMRVGKHVQIQFFSNFFKFLGYKIPLFENKGDEVKISKEPKPPADRIEEVYKTFFADYITPFTFNPISTLFIYSDIVEYQRVGDAYAPLLRTVAVPNNHVYGETVSTIYVQPHYIKVARNNINTIEINIKDDLGQRIMFNAGKAILKLHFRPKLN